MLKAMPKELIYIHLELAPFGGLLISFFEFWLLVEWQKIFLGTSL